MFKTITTYFDRENGEEIPKEKIKEYDILIKRKRKSEHNEYTGTTIIRYDAECERKRQTKLF